MSKRKAPTKDSKPDFDFTSEQLQTAVSQIFMTLFKHSGQNPGLGVYILQSAINHMREKYPDLDQTIELVGDSNVTSIKKTH